MANILGIDFGRSYVGVALSTSSLAEPLVVLDNDQSLIPELNKVIAAQSIDTIVIGLSEGQMGQETKAFAEQLKSQVPQVPIVFHDETLSSYEARLRLLHSKRSTREEPQDAFQAAFILQDYLDTHPSGQPPQS